MTNPSSKILPIHLGRNAYIYIRQSTLQQVLHNKESTERQYALTQRAFALGWAKEQVIVIDDDLGLSGKTAHNRLGFQRMVSDVGLGRAGAVIGIEVSRLARSSSDWHRLIELCTLGDTLIIDEDGVYDPRNFNDRLLLGLKGTMSEAELHFLRSRMWGGKLNKAQRGELAFCLPVGLTSDKSGAIVLDPDQQIQHTFLTLFQKFEELESAWKVMAYFRDHHLLFPSRKVSGDMGSETLWIPLSYGRVLGVLHNPLYAGTYAFGRRTERLTSPGRKSTLVPMEKWHVLIKNHFHSYIGWERFILNQKILKDNLTNAEAIAARGAPRSGPALLQGIVVCGVCGRRMTIRYKSNGHHSLSYLCDYRRKYFAASTCQDVKGAPVDIAVAQAFLKALQPAHLKVAFKAFEKIEENRVALSRHWNLRLERARFDAERAARQFHIVEPENRLVARSLEAQWNDKLVILAQIQRDFQTEQDKAPLTLTSVQREHITALSKDLPTLWDAPSTSDEDKKRLLRILIKDVTLLRIVDHASVDVKIHWKTGASSHLTVDHPRPQHKAVATPTAVIDLIRDKAKTLTDTAIAKELNRRHIQSGRGKMFHHAMVKWIRYAYDIPTACPNGPTPKVPEVRGDGRWTTQAVAKELGITIHQVQYLRQKGALAAKQATKRSPWWFDVTQEQLKEIRSNIDGKKLKRCLNPV